MRIAAYSCSSASSIGGAVFAAAIALGNDYVFFAGYVVLQYVVLSTAWNILGGYCGYVNFGTAAFFALGAYSTVAIYKFYTDARCPIPADASAAWCRAWSASAWAI